MIGSRARPGALLLAILVAWAAAIPTASARAQGTVEIVLPSETPFPAAPRIVVRTSGFPSALGTLQIRLRLSLTADLGLIVYDSTKFGSEASFTLVRLLPENRDIFAEAAVFDGLGRSLLTVIRQAGRTGPRLQLLDPDGRTGVSLETQQPRFSWRSASVTTPPGPWVYELLITNVATQETRGRGGIVDTVYFLPDTLQANTSYRWKVIARPLNGLASDSAVASSRSSFVIAPSNQPLATLLYQNFPNPFPAASSTTTCIWFDLRTPSTVRLTLHDLRGNLVRTLVPSQLVGAQLPAGRYGRLRELDARGCDPRFAWDGTADDGRTVPAGIYLVRLKTDATESRKKILFRGR